MLQSTPVLQFNPESPDNSTLKAILAIHLQSMTGSYSVDIDELRSRRLKKERQLADLQSILGYTVDEGQIYQWYDSMSSVVPVVSVR